MGTVKEKIFTASSGIVWGDYESIDLPTSSRNHPPQVVSVSAIANAGVGSAVLTLVLYDDKDTANPVKRRYDCTITAAATTQSGPDGASGFFLCTSVFAASGDHKQDLIPGNPQPQMTWRWGLSGLTTLTDVRVIMAFSEVI